MNIFLEKIPGRQKLRILEAHSALSAMIVEKAEWIEANGYKKTFDGLWLSSLTVSTINGFPDIELVDITTKLNLINEIRRVSTKPLIVDGDTGGDNGRFGFMVKEFAHAGVTAIVIEDKIGFKKNSLFEINSSQKQDSVAHFCEKIRIGKAVAAKYPIGIIARIESLILGKGLDDALERAVAYTIAGSDGILIHSKDETPESVIAFAAVYRNSFPDVPLLCVPSKFNFTYDKELFDSGFDIIIHANHLLRAIYPAMHKTALEILMFDRSFEACKDIMPIDQLLALISESPC